MSAPVSWSNFGKDHLQFAVRIVGSTPGDFFAGAMVMKWILGGACCLLAAASVCKAEFTFQGISRGVFGLTNIVNNRFIATANVGKAFGQQDSFITPSVAWVYSAVVNDDLPGFNSQCQFYLSVTQPTDALLML